MQLGLKFSEEYILNLFNYRARNIILFNLNEVRGWKNLR